MDTAHLPPDELATDLMRRMREALRPYLREPSWTALSMGLALFGAMRAEQPHASARSEDLITAAAKAACVCR